MINRSYYSSTIRAFVQSSSEEIVGKLSSASEFGAEQDQKNAWVEEIRILQGILRARQGSIYFEFSIPRMGRRVDVVLLIGPVVFVLEFKVGEKHFNLNGCDQVFDYALDLKNFHEVSHHVAIAPILIATESSESNIVPRFTPHNDNCFFPLKCGAGDLENAIKNVLGCVQGSPIVASSWEAGRYRPTPSIIEAATALYNGHSVTEISRSDATAKNLSITSNAISRIIERSKRNSTKSICFVTGVPGAGKTLVGLNVATQHIDESSEFYSVFLSGNGPLVAILREALARDKVAFEKANGRKKRKGEASSEVKAFIQNVHNFRDESLLDESPPVEHVALFDEAQRAWDLAKTADFMKRRKKRPGFNWSEPEFLISCLDRHKDWATVVCLVGGGQEINTGEAGIGEWIESLIRSYPQWKIHISSRLTDSEYNAQDGLRRVKPRSRISYCDDLHLGVSMRSFRAENVSLLVKQLLDLEEDQAKQTLMQLRDKYPITLTRDLDKAKQWLRDKARGSERFGIVVSSHAERLKPHAIDVKSPMNPIQWFLEGKQHVRSSYYLEDVATEFDIQGLELDWACVTWDADFRYGRSSWEHRSFVGEKWNQIKKQERQTYQKNAYRVLLTRARQGMVIVVPKGDPDDPTRKPIYYDPTYNYLRRIGFEVL
jgi:hypothetical protein